MVQSWGGGVIRVVVVEDVTAQEVGYLLDEALEEELEFSVWVGYCGGHDGNAVLNFYQLGIEIFLGKGQRLGIQQESQEGRIQ